MDNDGMTNQFREALLELLREIGHGPGEEYGLVSEAGAGLLPTLDSVTAQEASLPVAPGRPSLAAYTAHLTLSVQAAPRFLSGNAEQPDWDGAWRTTVVDEDTWAWQRETLRAALRSLEAALQTTDQWGADALRTALAAVAHAAYHAGAIRMAVRNLRSSAATARRGM